MVRRTYERGIIDLDKYLNDKGERMMSKGIRRTFTKEFKIDVVEKKINNIYRTKEICDIYDLDRQTLCRWVNEYKEGGEAAFDSKAVSDGDKVRRLKAENERLKRENEILKKAEAYFARRQQTK